MAVSYCYQYRSFVYLFGFFFVVVIDERSWYVAKAGLELTILPLQPLSAGIIGV
jgi:hypothetical protein